GEEGAAAARIEAVNVLQCAEERDLSEVVGFGQVAAVLRQPATGETPQQRQAAPEQLLAGLLLATADARDQAGRRLVLRGIAHRARPRGRAPIVCAGPAGWQPRPAIAVPGRE